VVRSQRLTPTPHPWSQSAWVTLKNLPPTSCTNDFLLVLHSNHALPSTVSEICDYFGRKPQIFMPLYLASPLRVLLLEFVSITQTDEEK